MVSRFPVLCRSGLAALRAGLLLVSLSLLTFMAQSQVEEPPTGASESAEGAPQQGAVADNIIAPLPTLEEIDAIFEGDDAVLSGGGYTYDPGGRRDPFKSLRISSDTDRNKGPRPEGIPGLLIDEILLSGIIKTRNGFMAQVQSADQQKSYLLKVGDQLFDGDVISISSKEIVFKQNVQDRTALKPFREVVKSLNP